MVRPQYWTSFPFIACDYDTSSPHPISDRSARKSEKRRGEVERKQTSRAWASLSRPRIRIGIPPVFSSSFALESASRATCRSESDRGNRYLIEHPGRGTSSDGETTMEFNASLYFFLAIIEGVARRSTDDRSISCRELALVEHVRESALIEPAWYLSVHLVLARISIPPPPPQQHTHILEHVFPHTHTQQRNIFFYFSELGYAMATSLSSALSSRTRHSY